MPNDPLGRLGERAAAEFLKKSGYTILANNYRAKPGEIDLIASAKNVVVFIEVKTRRSTAFGTPAEAVNYRKQQKIIKTALCYLQQHGLQDVPVQFDIVEVYVAEPEYRCVHITNAFGN